MPDKMTQGEDRPAARLRRRGRGRADRRGAGLAAVLLPRRGPADRGDPRRVPAQPVRQPGQPGDALRRPPGRSCGARAAGRSRTSSSASAPAARSPASGATSRSRTRDIAGHRRRPGRLDLLGRRGPSRTSSRASARTSGRRRSIRRSSTATCACPTRKLPHRAPPRRDEGLLAGGSCGTALYAALTVARELDDPNAMVAVVLPDGGQLPDQGLQRRVDAPARLPRAPRRDDGRRRAAGQARGGEIPPLVTVDTHQRVRDAIALLHEHRVSQLPVVSATTRVRRRLDRRARAAAPRGRRPGGAERADRRRDGAAVPRRVHDRPGARGGRAALRRAPGAARHRGRAPAGIVTRADLLESLVT